MDEQPETFVLEVWRCPCSGADAPVMYDHWGRVTAYHLPQECSKRYRATVAIERSMHRPRTSR